jgi:hypothetical protein
VYYLVYTVFYPKDVADILAYREFVEPGEPCFIGIYKFKKNFVPNLLKHINPRLRALAERTACKPLNFEVEKRLEEWGRIEDHGQRLRDPEGWGMLLGQAQEIRDDLVRTTGTLATHTGPLLNADSRGLVDLRPRRRAIRRDEGARVEKFRAAMQSRRGRGI